MTQRHLTIDPDRTTTLGDGWRATVAIDQDGNESCWLVSPNPHLPAGCACRTCAPHDQLQAATSRPPTTNRSPAP